MPSSPLFDLHHIAVRLGGRLALEVDHLQLHAGERVALIGPNGAGKTTLLRLLAGLVEPAAGTISGVGTPVAYVGQRHDQHPWMPLTVAEVLRMGRYRQRGLLGRLTNSDRTCIAEAAERLEIADLTKRSFGELSGGQQQRVLIAGAIAGEATCLLLDEPITGLDIPSQQLITQVVADESERGNLVVMSTHHLDEARHCGRVLILATDIVGDGTPEAALQPELLAMAFGERVLRLDDASGRTVMLDDHGHDHGHDHHHQH